MNYSQNDEKTRSTRADDAAVLTVAV